MRSQFNLQCQLFPLYPIIKDSGDDADESRSQLSEPGVVFKRPISADSVWLRRSLGRLCLAGTWDMPRIVTVPTPAHCSPCREPLPMHRAVHTALAAPLTTPYPPNAHHAACRSFNRALGESMKGLEVV